jgi:general secretion pathway protein K
MAHRFKTRSRQPQQGIALLAVLWVVTLLFLLALLLSQSVQIETRTAIYRKEAAQAQALALGGVEAAMLEIAYPRGEDERASPLWSWQRGQRGSEVAFERGRARLEIVNESGRVDLNNAGEVQLMRLLAAREVESATAQALARAIVHWRSPAGLEAESAALDEYYGSLPEPDRPRHAPFKAVEEVLRVRRMSREIFYGTAEVTKEGKIRRQYGVGQDLTVFSRSAQINVNYASVPALESVPGVGPELAAVIIQERRRRPFRTVAEITQRLPVYLPDEALPFLTTSEVDTYGIVSEGEVTGSNVRRTLEAIVQITPQQAGRYRILRWYEDYASQ